MGWFAAILAGTTALCWIPLDFLGRMAIADAAAVHSASLMVGLGVSLTVIVTAWSGTGERVQPDSQSLIRAFGAMGALAILYILAGLSPHSLEGIDRVAGSVLGPGIALTMATGIFAAAWLRRGSGIDAPQSGPIALLPVACAVLMVLLGIGCALAEAGATGLRSLGAGLAGMTVLLYIAASARLGRADRRHGADDVAFMLAGIAAGLLAELLAWLPGPNPGLRMLASDACRILAVISLYSALFQQMARGPFLELRSAESALQAEQRQLARARRIAKLGSWEWQIGSDAVWTSEEVRQMFGIPPEKAGMTRSEFENYLYREDIPRLRAAADAALEDRQPYSIDYRILGADGSPRTMHSEAQVERDDANRAIRMLGIVQDITERVAVEHALRESADQIRHMNAELEQRVTQRTRQLAAANKELEAFGYSVSHDLQAPLRRIERYAELLSTSNGTRLDDAGRDMLKRIQDASTQTKRLISDILKLSQITRAELRRVAVDLSSLAGRVLEQIERGSNPPRRVEVTVDPDIVVEADAAMLQILLDNLIGNAWKFTSRTEIPRIRVGAIEGGDGRGFFVSDNGAGFDMQHAHKLFGAFQRLHSQDEFKGTGIGLAIVQRIVNIHGWQIQAAGESGHGATFTIRAQ